MLIVKVKSLLRLLLLLEQKLQFSLLWMVIHLFFSLNFPLWHRHECNWPCHFDIVTNFYFLLPSQTNRPPGFHPIKRNASKLIERKILGIKSCPSEEISKGHRFGISRQRMSCYLYNSCFQESIHDSYGFLFFPFSIPPNYPTPSAFVTLYRLRLLCGKLAFVANGRQRRRWRRRKGKEARTYHKR